MNCPVSRRISGLLVLAALLLAAAPLAAQDILLFESFDGVWDTRNPPAGWRIAFDDPPMENDWSRAPENHQRWPDNATPFALLDSFPLESDADSLISPRIDCRNCTAVTLRCSTSFRGSELPYAALLLGSTNGRVFDHVVFDYNSRTVNELQVLELPWAAGMEEVYLAWVFLGESDRLGHWAIDNVTVTATRSDLDVGVDVILAPVGEVLLNSTIPPAAAVRNHGQSPASFWTLLSIGTGHLDSAFTAGLAPAGVETLSFRPWTAFPAGRYPVQCFTRLPGDVNPANDTANAEVTVVMRDLGITTIISPPDTVDTGEVFMPAVRVRNFGPTEHPGAWCVFTLDDQPAESVATGPLGAGTETDVEFSQHSISVPGGHRAFWRLRVVDANPTNDTAGRNFFVRGGAIIDAAAIEILNPTGSVPESSSVQPRAVLANHGEAPAMITINFAVLNGIGIEVYTDQSSGIFPAATIDTFSFREWTAFPSGDYTAQFTVHVENDMNPANDTTRRVFQVSAGAHDVGVASIVAPVGIIQEGAITPRARIANYGAEPETFRAVFVIDRDGSPVYTDTIDIINLTPGLALTMGFAPWNATLGDYVARCSTMLAGDGLPGNDAKSGTFRVEAYVPDPGWEELAPVPEAPGGKPVKRGGSLALLEAGDGAQVFALKGNKTRDFFRFDPTAGTWTTLAQVPAGPEDKPVEKGGCLCSDGERYIYMTKGNNTLEFWRYDLGDTTWHSLPDVPTGLSGKAIKGGTDMAYVVDDTTAYIYLLKGYKTEFYRFNIAGQTWETLEPAPVGIKEKWDKGSFLVYDGAGTIYAHKASYYDKTLTPPHHQMFAFDLPTLSWGATPVNGLPLYGLHGGSVKKKKSKDGAGGAWYDGFIAALKGGNTQQFFKYLPAEDTWLELDTVPQFGSTNKKKRVGPGGDIVSLGNGTLLALKGNKTSEFWQFRFGGGSPVAEAPPAPAPAARLALRPNPARHVTSLSLPGTGPAEVRVYDAAGKSLKAWRTDGAAALRLDLDGIAPGVYLVRATRGGREQTAKLVIQ